MTLQVGHWGGEIEGYRAQFHLRLPLQLPVLDMVTSDDTRRQGVLRVLRGVPMLGEEGGPLVSISVSKEPLKAAWSHLEINAKEMEETNEVQG